jgi:hypothetical protein
MPATAQKNLAAMGAAADMGLAPDVEQQLLDQDELEKKKKKVAMAVNAGVIGTPGGMGASSVLGI